MTDVPLPEPTGDISLPGAFGLACDGYSGAQLLAYGDARVAAERERCALILDANADASHGVLRQVLRSNAQAIRSGLDAASPAGPETPTAGGA